MSNKKKKRSKELKKKKNCQPKKEKKKKKQRQVGSTYRKKLVLNFENFLCLIGYLKSGFFFFSAQLRHKYILYYTVAESKI